MFHSDCTYVLRLYKYGIFAFLQKKFSYSIGITKIERMHTPGGYIAVVRSGGNLPLSRIAIYEEDITTNYLPIGEIREEETNFTTRGLINDNETWYTKNGEGPLTTAFDTVMGALAAFEYDPDDWLYLDHEEYGDEIVWHPTKIKWRHKSSLCHQQLPRPPPGDG